MVHIRLYNLSDRRLPKPFQSQAFRGALRRAVHTVVPNVEVHTNILKDVHGDSQVPPVIARIDVFVDRNQPVNKGKLAKHVEAVITDALGEHHKVIRVNCLVTVNKPKRSKIMSPITDMLERLHKVIRGH